MRTFGSVSELAALKGQAIGHSEWVTVGQPEIDLFAEATGDRQWIHIDPERAATGPFGTTIAHGFMTLALLPRLWGDMYRVDGVRMGVNYGLNKVRFPSPVAVGARIRAHSDVTDVEDLGGGVVQVTLSTTIEIDGGAKPACVAESIVRYIT